MHSMSSLRGKSCCRMCKHGLSGSFVSLNVSNMEVIMDCLNRDIMMILGSELLMALWVWGVGWRAVLSGVFCACFFVLISHESVHNVVCVSHIPLLLICSVVILQ